LLPDALDTTKVAGIICTITEVLDLKDGRLLMELQAGRLDRQTTLKIQELLRTAQEERSN